MTKYCTKCNTEQPIENFGKSKSVEDGIYPTCKNCRRVYYLKNRDRILKEKVEYRIKNLEKMREKNRKHYIKHKEEISIKGKEYRKREAENITDRKLQRKYGITSTIKKEMLMQQGERCKICKDELTNPQIDHCHVTGKVRGILCVPCNTVLGLLKEDLSRVNMVYLYLFAYQNNIEYNANLEVLNGTKH